ncbi:MAG TPA: lamin tail domain-containing protein, partial [Candidatus Saccharimonadales bacterium]|nr:lamin tail domain-containing protein [Candidatus Saccharimonadales bacterium]
MHRIKHSLCLILLLLPFCLRPAYGVDSIVVFNEINYHPITNEAAGEWVEFHNQMTIDIDLSAWSIQGDVQYAFPGGTIIPGGGYLVVASSPSTLQTESGVTNVLGPFTGRLKNSGGSLELRDRNDRLMDAIQFTDTGKWPIAPDGSGATLAKVDPDFTSNDGEHWSSSIINGGTPGAVNFPRTVKPTRSTLIALNSLWRFEASGTDLGTTWKEPGFNDAAWAGRNNATLVSYWPFDGNAGAVRGTAGSFVGAVTATTDRNGSGGGALAFNGAAQQYVSVPGGGGLNAAAAGTVSMWVRWNGLQDGDCCGSFGAVLARQGNGLFSDDILALNTADPTTAKLVWRQSGGPAPILITSVSTIGSTWHHIAITFASSGSTLYLDGAPQGTATGSGMANNPGVPLSIGAWAGDGGGFSTASIDDVAIWDQPLNAGQIAQLANQSKTPLDFLSPESAIYYAGDGKLTSNDELRRTALPTGPNTYYFRSTFQFTGDIVRSTLSLDVAVDDGAIFYLNGTEILRRNMPAGSVTYGTYASSPVGDAAIVNGLSLPTSSLIQGTNVLAVEVHQAAPADTGMVFGAALSAVITPAPAVFQRTLVSRNDTWRYDASDTDLGSAWRALAYSDSSWFSAAALFFAGNGAVTGVLPEKVGTITASASSEYTADNRLAANAVNGAGLIGNTHVNTPAGTMWMTRGTFVAPNDLNPQITFDLGSPLPLRFMKLWNYNEDVPNRPELLSRGAASGDILIAGNDGIFSTLVPNQLFNKGSGTQTDFSQVIDFAGVSARYIKLDKLTNFPGGDFRFVGLSEVQFFRDPDLNRTEIPLGASTYYFRKTFNFAGDPSHATLTLNSAVDDGAVFYLNGVEIYRANMPAGAITHSTPAASAVGQPAFSGPIAISASTLVRGLNVLAVEVHRGEGSADPDMIFGAELTATITPPEPADFDPGSLVFNEISAGGLPSFQIELFNRGPQTVNLNGYIVQRTGVSADAAYLIPAQPLLAGQFLTLDQSTLGFGAVPGDKLFLILPGRRGIADSVEVHARPLGRSPDGLGAWLTPGGQTLGSSNTFSLHDELVINEIMYHGPPALELPAAFSTNMIITLSNNWRYEQSGTDLGTAWRTNNYDDTAWPIGTGLFYNTTAVLPGPKNTPLNLGPNTYYFRTTFVYTGAPAILALSLRHVVDDGAVFYFNGVEVSRFNLTSGTISYTNKPIVGIGTATLRGAGNLSLTNLHLGTNVLAVEVHQAVNPGNDVVFGADLSATIQVSPKMPFTKSPEEWVELFNRSSNAVNLTGWRLDEAIDLRFAPNTIVPPGGYLVVAKDPAALLLKFPGIPVVGPYTNKLSHRGARIVLKDSADNPADSVYYYDDGRWPQAPDAGGSSLELRDPRADHNAGEAWGASIESGRSTWRTYTYRGIAAASSVGPDGQWHEFVMGLLDAGEVLLDDIQVIEAPNTTATNLIQNSTFESGLGHWRIIGNHHGEVIADPDQPGNKVLRLVATGSTEHMSNHGETTFAGNRDIINGTEYQISFRAKWISGARQLHTRLYFNRLPHVTRLDVPDQHGTPGAQNSVFTPNIGPTYSELQHTPPVPAPFETVNVSLRSSDPDGIASMTLWSRVDGGNWSTAAMSLSDDGRYAASLPGKLAGTIVQFYVEGIDSLGAHSFFPSDGTNSRALYKVDDGLAAANGLHNIRFIALTTDADQLFKTINLMSNERIGCTLIYDEREIFYDIAFRLKGSEHSRTTTPRLGFNIGFPTEHKFRGVHHSVAIDRSESTGFGQREMLLHQMLNHAGGVPTKYHDLVQIIAPRPEYTGSAELQLARYTDVFLDDQYKDGSDGMVFEYELVYQLNPPTDDGTPEGNKVPAPDSVVGTTIRNLGDDKENYRWDFLIKNNEDRDDYTGIIPFCKAMELTGAAFNSQITNYIEVDQWLRCTAANALTGAGDSYGGDGSQHNVQFYVRPSDNKVLYFNHDMDAFFDVNRSIYPNNDLNKIISVPAFARLYYGHLLDIISTTYNGGYLGHWADQFGRLLPGQNFAAHLAFVVQRASVVTTAVNNAVPNVAFAITSNSGNNFSTNTNSVTITGTAPLGVRTIEVNGVSYPVTWPTLTGWAVAIPLFNGVNNLNIQGVGPNGVHLSTAVDTITITNSASGTPFPVIINEWMADNAGPAGLPDTLDGLYQDWFELFNPNTNAVSLSGFYLTDTLSQPTKWQIPAGVSIPANGFLLVWADNQT